MVDLNKVDLDWTNEPLLAKWAGGRDNNFILARIEKAFLKTAGDGTPGRLLDLACGDGKHIPALREQGWNVFGLEPSPAMIDKAKATFAEAGTRSELLRAIGEVLPFQDEIFDRVLCESSLDHFANPAEGMREIARVLKPDGTAVIGIVNYHGAGCRGSRLAYALGRRLGRLPRDQNQFWDTPVPHEHTFEGSLPALKRMASPWLELEHVYGVSLFWGFPGWAWLLARLPKASAFKLLGGLNRVARVVPSASDFLIMRWRRV